MNDDGEYTYEGLYSWMLPFSGRSSALCVSLQGHLVIVGGYDQACNPVMEGVSVYNPETDKWRVGDPSPLECYDDTHYTVVDDTLYVYPTWDTTVMSVYKLTLGQGLDKDDMGTDGGGLYGDKWETVGLASLPCAIREELLGVTQSVGRQVLSYDGNLTVRDKVSGETTVYQGPERTQDDEHTPLYVPIASGESGMLFREREDEGESSDGPLLVARALPEMLYPQSVE
ncbi:hypothetical protein KIPB_008242 [Kipferlia bialata]|uniref:Uncharacterized protein n=2 Tax=Kipferlia bialata TaxID=797122 RepID=A0A9K3D228_9EUKA|nr:hypothetical protein KIPB_008242 [Kipferlia bialata]|eukprot:g8242.t1